MEKKYPWIGTKDWLERISKMRGVKGVVAAKRKDTGVIEVLPKAVIAGYEDRWKILVEARNVRELFWKLGCSYGDRKCLEEKLKDKDPKYVFVVAESPKAGRVRFLLGINVEVDKRKLRRYLKERGFELKRIEEVEI